MRKWMIAVLAFGLAQAAAPAPAADEAKDTWVPLFNGTDLEGWQVYPKGTGKWKVEKGILIGSGNASHLFTKRGDYKNVRFRVEAKINDKGNSGQYVHARFEAGFPRGW